MRARRNALSRCLLSLFVVAGLAVSGTATAARTAPQDRVAAAVASLGIAGTAWVPDGDGTRILADATVTAADLTRLRQLDGSVRLERVEGRLRPLLSGGDGIHASTARCTAGVNVRGGSEFYVITAGHCTRGATTWYTDPGLTTPIGPTTATSYPGNDFGLIRHTNPAVPRPGTIGAVDVTGAATGTIGLVVCHRGAVSGVRCGRITALNATVNYGGAEIVYGLIQTNICAEPGDSGAPLYAGDKVIGILSGGSGGCTTGGTGYYQPIQEALSLYGLSVY
ncbi:S1 family peptidase [Streptomyces sp. NPDC059477]|uniref:S1 family peptidase n=1 Tax=Streptomyces sp. NPDC059477 TaxID=3346847 RepID=UPI0036A11886